MDIHYSFKRNVIRGTKTSKASLKGQASKQKSEVGGFGRLSLDWFIQISSLLIPSANGWEVLTGIPLVNTTQS